MLRELFSKKYSIIVCVLISAVLYYFSTGLEGGYWFMLWLAPVPVLLFSFYNAKIPAFLAAFLAVFLSKADMAVYLINTLSWSLAFIFILLTSTLFAFVILLTRTIVAKVESYAAVFIFPVLMTSMEYILSLTIGTFGSLAYTQANSIFFIQTASITGMYGITFTVSLFASFIAFLTMIESKKTGSGSFIIPSIILIVVVVFGAYRTINLSDAKGKEKNFKVLLIAVDSLASHQNIYNPKNRDILLQRYIELIGRNKAELADIIILPEKTAGLTPEEKPSYYSNFSKLAFENGSLITAGFKIDGSPDKNIAAVFFPDGKTVLEYQKKYLVEGWERSFGSGSNVLIFDYKNIKIGTAICRDMDYPEWIRKYSSADILLVPSWDFRADNWWHSRMAVLRGVDNGFTILRPAKEGDLTVSGPCGQIIKESVFDKNKRDHQLISDIKIVKRDTFYSKTGDWFCIINLIAAFYFAVFAVVKRSAVIK